MSHEKILLGVLQANGLLPAESSDGMYLELLTGGFWNRVYRLRSKQLSTLDWVVKQFADVPANPMFPILPAAEYAALQFLKGHQCAPTPLAFIADSPVGSLLVYEYVKGSYWNGDLEATATLLGRVHSIPIDPFAANAFRQLPSDAPNLLTHAEVMLQRHESALSDSVRELSRRLSFETVHPIRNGVLVHTDCGPGNIVSSPDGLRLIDWQCPGIGDGLQDVLTLCLLQCKCFMVTRYSRWPRSNDFWGLTFLSWMSTQRMRWRRLNGCALPEAVTITASRRIAPCVRRTQAAPTRKRRAYTASRFRLKSKCFIVCCHKVFSYEIYRDAHS